MKYIFLYIVLLLLAINFNQFASGSEEVFIQPTEAEYQKQFLDWMQKFCKSYTNIEFAEKFAIFKDTLNYVLKFNSKCKDNSSPDALKMSLNPYSDLSLKEFTKIYAGFPTENTTNKPKKDHPSGGSLLDVSGKISILGRTILENTEDEIPESVDWSYTTPTVHNQGTCASCYTFSAVGALESAYRLFKDQTLDLSEQNLVDCVANGCNTGFMTSCFNFIKKYGILSEESYPYTGKDGKCYTNRDQVVATVQGYVEIEPGNEDALTQAIAKRGAISGALYSSLESFKNYGGGIYEDENCTPRADHAIVIVGYSNKNDEEDTPYYKIKNSWSSDWGENGFMRIKKGNNQCSIASHAVYPLV